MTAEKRIKLIRLQEKLNSNKKFAEDAGIEWNVVSKDERKDEKNAVTRILKRKIS